LDLSPARPAGAESFRKCPMTGCPVNVWGPINTENYCREHGGAPFFQVDDAEYGTPRTAAQAGPLPRPAPAP